uniref:hypothetical protein n=1 Tax=Clostridium sp. NkU-1 TaxID=1095009 RepID=UPI0006CFDE41
MNFYFFDERRRNIAWEVDMQDYLLKVLLFDEEYFVKFKDLEDKIIQEDTKGRHKSEERRIAEESYEELIKAQKELIDEIKVGTNVEQEEKLDKEQLKIKRNNITGKIDNLAYDISLIQEDLDSLILDLNNIEGELTASSVKCDVIKEEIRKKEASLYKSIYSKMPDYYYTLEKNLLSDGKCLVCNSKSNNLKIEAIRKKNNNECFICSSKLSTVEKFSNKDIEILNELNLQKEKQENRNQNLLSRLNDLTNKVNEVKQKQYTKKTELDSLQKQMIIIENEIDRTDDNYKTDTYNEILKKIKKKIIERLGQESKEAYAKRDEYKNDLNSYTQKFKSLMSHLTVELSSYFNKYASTFIGLDCELTVSEKVIRKIPHIVYIPKIANQIRKDIWSVSESQRFFLDQAFRMAIIDYLQKNISDFSSFFITETPEGSLDAAYENQVAEMFSIFAQSDNKIIFTSNLNSSNFLYDIFF